MAFSIKINEKDEGINGLVQVRDCLEGLKEIPSEQVELILTDPPFNIGKKYDSPFKDTLSEDEYFKWCHTWLLECFRILKPKGSVYLFNFPRNNAYLMPFIDRHLLFKRWLTWHYHGMMGISKYNYRLSQHSILYYIKGNKWSDCTWNKDALDTQYRNLNDSRIKEQIALGMKPSPWDVIEMEQVKNVSKDKVNHPCQLPIALVENLIKASSNANDIVLDPFGGSGTTFLAAKNLKRRFIGFELAINYGEIIASRVGLTKLDDTTYFLPA